MRLGTRLERLELIASTLRPAPAAGIPFDFDAYKAAFDAAMEANGIDAVMAALEATFRDFLGAAGGVRA